MMRLAPPLVSAAALLALLAGPAQSKELAAARACDDDGCRTITAGAALRGMDGGQPRPAPDEGAPFYRVHMRVRIEGGEDFHYTLAYVPAAGLLRVRGQLGGYDWLSPTPRGRHGFDRLTRGLAPLPARRLGGVGIDEPEPAARVDEVVQPPRSAAYGGGFPSAVLLIPAGVMLAAAAWAARRRRARPRVAPQAGT